MSKKDDFIDKISDKQSDLKELISELNSLRSILLNDVLTLEEAKIIYDIKLKEVLR